MLPDAGIAVSNSGGRRKVADATERLAALNRQADELREHLAKLRHELADVQRDLSATRADELREANEKLVLAAYLEELNLIRRAQPDRFASP